MVIKMDYRSEIIERVMTIKENWLLKIIYDCIVNVTRPEE